YTTERKPLPPDLADDKVTHAIVTSLVSMVDPASAGGVAAKAGAAHRGAPAPGEPTFPEEKLTVGDFKRFAEHVVRESFSPFQAGGTSHAPSWLATAPTSPDEISFAKLLLAYMTAYYNGQFVDRNGGTYSKPQLGASIPDETVTAVVSIFLEALYDYASFPGTRVKDPILFKSKGCPGNCDVDQYYTAKG